MAVDAGGGTAAGLDTGVDLGADTGAGTGTDADAGTGADVGEGTGADAGVAVGTGVEVGAGAGAAASFKETVVQPLRSTSANTVSGADSAEMWPGQRIAGRAPGKGRLAGGENRSMENVRLKFRHLGLGILG